LDKLPLSEVVLAIGNMNPTAITCHQATRTGQTNICVVPEPRLAQVEAEAKKAGVLYGVIIGGVAALIIAGSAGYMIGRG
jgi:hypothetical protein